MDEGDYRAAIAQLKEVVRLEPDNFEAHLDLGICYAQKGFYAEAERAYGRARELNADDLLLHYNLAALYALWGEEARLAGRPQDGRWNSTGPRCRAGWRPTRCSTRSRATRSTRACCEGGRMAHRHRGGASCWSSTPSSSLAEMALVKVRAQRGCGRAGRRGPHGGCALLCTSSRTSTPYLSVIQFGVTLCLAGHWLGGRAGVRRTLGRALAAARARSGRRSWPRSPTFSVLVGFALVTVLYLVLGELVPKSLGHPAGGGHGAWQWPARCGRCTSSSSPGCGW